MSNAPLSDILLHETSSLFTVVLLHKPNAINAIASSLRPLCEKSRAVGTCPK